MRNKRLLCKIGFHKYGRWRIITNFSSNVNDLEKRCKRCNIIKRKTKIK